MSTETLTQAIAAGGQGTFGAGRIFLVIGADQGAPVTVNAVKLGSGGTTRRFTNVPAGFKFTADALSDGFDLLQVTSAVAQNVTIAVGDDDITFSNQVTVSGVVQTKGSPATTLADTPPKVCPNAAQTQVVPVNASRRRVTLSTDDPTGVNVVYFRSSGGANNLMQVQQGVLYQFDGTYAIDVRNDSGAGVGVRIAEEL